MKRILGHSVTILVVFLFALSLHALNPKKKVNQYIIDVWNSDQGLPMNSTTGIVGTEDGYLWLSTQRGMIRFNGMDFLHFDKSKIPVLKHSAYIASTLKLKNGTLALGTQDGELIRMHDGMFTPLADTPSSMFNSIYALMEDEEGHIWIGSQSPVLAILKGNQFSEIKDKELADFQWIRSICRDANNNIWLGGSHGLLLYKNGRFTRYTEKDGLSAKDIDNIIQDHRGRLLMTAGDMTLNILTLPHRKTGTSSPDTPNISGNIEVVPIKSSLPGDKILRLYEDRSHSLWIGTRSGLARIEDGKAHFITTRNGLTNNVVTSLYEDNEGSLWVGTTLGISRLRDGKVSFFGEEQGLPYAMFWCVMEDKDGVMWMGTHGNGIVKAANSDLTDFKIIRNLPHGVVRTLYQDRQNRIWVGTANGPVIIKNDEAFSAGTLFKGMEKLENKVIRSIYQDTSGTFWFGCNSALYRTVNNTLTRFQLEPHFNRFHFIYEDPDNQLWVGTRQGLLRIDLKTHQYRCHTEADGLPDKVVMSVCPVPSGTLWFGSYGGLIRYQNGVFDYLDTSKGLPDNVIYSVLADSNDRLWISSNNGIAMMRLDQLNHFLDGETETLDIDTFNRSDGMPIDECNGGSQSSGCLSKNGLVWFPTSKGMVKIDFQLIKKNEIPPQVVIDMTNIDDRRLNTENKGFIKMKADIHKVEFHYSAISFIAPQKVRFKYILENFDHRWVDAGNRRIAYYTNLPPGEYHFKVIAANSDGVWNHTGASLTLQLIPNFYQTSVFYALCGILLLVIIYLLYRLRVSQLRKKEKEMAQMIAQRTRDLEMRKDQLEEANKQIIQERELAETANRAKSEFLARMSHEIRTPMNSIIGFTDLIAECGLSDEQKDYAQIIKFSSESLLSVINDILDFSKIEAGQMTFEHIDFDPELTVYNVCELIRPKIGEKRLELLCRIGDGVPAYVKGDPGRFRQVILNLVSNAVKFTEAGEIEIVLDLVYDDNRLPVLHTRVRDTGTGIPPDKLESIFAIFAQADGSTTRKFGGTGLGLPICRQIANLMGGHVWVENNPPATRRHDDNNEKSFHGGNGCTFHFTALMAPADKTAPTKCDSQDLRGKKILVVDDNPKNLDILCRQLQLAHIKTVSTQDPMSTIPLLAEAMTAQEPFDLCIIDIHMPEIDGYQLASQIRKRTDSLAKVPLLAFSSSAYRGALQTEAYGFNGYLPKPINRKKLIHMLERLLCVPREGGEKREEGPIITQHTITEEAKHHVRILLAEDNPINQKLARQILTKAGYELDVVNNGKEAVDTVSAAPHRYNLILMDVQMPEMDGLEATQIIRSRAISIPIIAMTAGVMLGDKDICINAGMNDFIPKPIKREKVLEMVMKWAV